MTEQSPPPDQGATPAAIPPAPAPAAAPAVPGAAGAPEIPGVPLLAGTPEAADMPEIPEAPVDDEPAHAASAGPVADSQQEDNAGRHTEPIAAGAGDTGDETVVIEVPQPAPTPGGDREPDGGDPSLKKLFWGEDR